MTFFLFTKSNIKKDQQTFKKEIEVIYSFKCKEILLHLYFSLGDNGTIYNLKNKAHYP